MRALQHVDDVLAGNIARCTRRERASAEAAERAFTGEDQRFVYSRYGNPTVHMFQERLRRLEERDGDLER